MDSTIAAPPADSEVVAHADGGMTFAGPDGVGLYRAIALKTALNSYVRSRLVMNRHWTLARMLAAASGITGRKYPRSAAGATAAAKDVGRWAECMRLGLPFTDEAAPAGGKGA